MNAHESNPTLDASTLAWLALMIGTGLGWWFGHGGGWAALATTGVIVTAFAKVWLVGFQFMELRAAPRWLWLAFTAWCVCISAALLGVSFL